MSQERLLELWRPLHDLRMTRAVLEWDQETMMPPGGAAARARALATLAGEVHARLVDDALHEAALRARDAAEEGSVEHAQALVALRDVERARRVPARLARELAEATSAGLVSWQAARKESDFARFAPDLERIVRLKEEEAQAVADGGRPYDALLDEYEPGTREADLVPLFERIRAELSPRIRAVAESGVVVDESPAQGQFPEAHQRALGLAASRAIGFDHDAGRLDLAAHPFCTSFSPRDVRITWRFQEDDFRPALYGILHESGHGLYEQGLPLEWEGQPLGEAAGLGIHESQSRLWENAVGRSRGFLRWLAVPWREAFGAPMPDVEELWPALHTCRPSLIRVEADESTYDLHVLVRFELERRLFSGELATADLPAAWNGAYEEVLGLRPANDAEGVLQDIHWAMGAFGYFPTYTLGNLMAAQLFAAAGAELGDLEAAFAAGEFAPLREWLREKVHRHGRRWRSAELVERASGRPLTPDDHLARLAEQVETVYGVTVGGATG